MDAVQTKTVSLRDLAHVIFKHRYQIVLFFLATIITVSVGTFMTTATYEARSKLLLKMGRENIYVPTAVSSVNQTPVVSTDREQQINSEIEILTSQALIVKVAVALGPAKIYGDLDEENRAPEGILTKLRFSNKKRLFSPLEEAVLRLQKALTVEAVKKSNVIEIKFKHNDPQMAAVILNKLVEVFMGHHLEVYKSHQSHKFFQEQSDALESKLKDSEAYLESFNKEHQVSSLGEQRSLLLNQEGALRVEFNRTLSQIVETENRIAQMQQQLAVSPKTVPIEEQIEHNPEVVSSLQARLMELELKEKELQAKYTDQSRLVQNVKEDIKIVRSKLGEQETKQYGRSRSGLNPTYQRLQEEVYRNNADLKALRAKETAQRSQIAEYGGRIERLNRVELDLNRLLRQVDIDKQNYKLYLTRLEESRISEAMDAEKITNVVEIEPATRPLAPVSPKVMMNLFLGVFLAAFGGLGLAFLMEYLDDRIEKPEDAEKVLNLPVLASIPELRA
jgi:uncharacterized protein involved in exopolysaccharide biosynthesis